MTIIAIIFHKLGHYIPLRIIKDNFKNLRNEFSLKRIFIELSGSLFNIFIAFLIIFFINLSTPEEYLLTEDLIYGIKFSSAAKETGFKDGDKIIAINNNKIVEFSEITEKILFSEGKIPIEIQRKDSILQIKLTDSDKYKLRHHNIYNHFLPIMTSPELSGENTKLEFRKRKKGFKETTETLTGFLKHYKLTLFRKDNAYKSTGTLINFSGTTDIKGLLFLFALSSFFIGLVNLLPFPGLDLGNVIIALIEKLRKKKFNEKKIKKIRIISSSIVIVLILIKLYTN